jgi:protein involved in polysaccharide export with SLBB domain
MRFGSTILVLATCALLLDQGPSQGAEIGYALGASDKVRIRVNEWRTIRVNELRATSGQVNEWEMMSGEYTVNAAGAISIPLVGEVPAAGLATDKLATVISERLQAKVGMVPRPEVAVEIIQFRPFYILGAVNRPGDYPFRPGLTVLQAVGVAGGFFRPTEWRLEREAITAVGDLRVIDIERSALMARKARLEAEMKGDTALTFPPELLKQSNNPAVGRFLDQEQVIFRSRQNTLLSQTEALEQVKLLLQNEIKSLREKYQVQERQLGLARKEFGAVESLVNKGLAVTARQFSLEQQVAQIESTRLDMSMAILRAEQDRSKAERDILELRNRRQDDIATSIKEAEVKLQEFAHKAVTARALIAETQAAAPSSQPDKASVVFSIVRRTENVALEPIVSENTLLQPDDVLRVRLSFDAMQQPETR